ncbi:MAG: tRNA adenosine(34) deaminase TadA [Pseudomonadota bacterium]
MALNELDQKFMERALELARSAAGAGEVPVGAVLVRKGVILGEASNSQISMNDPTAHAEVLALRAAGAAVGNYRLPDSVLYVSLEPCTMCCGALVHARVRELVFAAREPRAGAVISARRSFEDPHLNHRVCWRELIDFAPLSGQLLRDFFKQRR